MILTAVGPDRPGIVGELSEHLFDKGGNLLDTRMVNLRGQFAIMILLEIADDAARGLIEECQAAGQRMGLKLTVTPQQSLFAPRQGVPYLLKTYSMDQPGIVARVASVLRSLGVNIEELSAKQESAPFAGSTLFSTEMRLTVPPDVSLVKLRQQLETVGNELNCDVDLDPA
jgi:glycine cleavage system transcriptional repressor